MHPALGALAEYVLHSLTLAAKCKGNVYPRGEFHEKIAAGLA
jgi:hypothetical protein